MDRRTRSNLVLVGLACGLGLLVWMSLRQGAVPDHAPLTQLIPADVQTLRIRVGNRPEVRLVRRLEGWRLERPYDLPADDERVERLLTIAAAPTLGEVDLTGRDPAEFGLTPPAAVLLLDDTRIAIAGEHPLKGRRFVEADGRLAVIAERYLPLALAPPEALIHPAPLQGIAPAAIETAAWRIEPTADGGWGWSAGREGRGDPAALVQAWREVIAKQVTPAPPNAGPDAQAIRILPAGAPSPITFALTGDGDERVLIREGKGIAYHLAAEVAGRLGLAGPVR